MTDNEILEFKEMLFKKFSNEDVRYIEYKLLEVLKKRENALVKIDRNNDENLLRMFLMTKKSENLSDRTLEYYKTTLVNFAKAVNKSFVEMTDNDIKIYLAKKQFEDKVTPVTVNNIRRNISSFYSWMQEQEILLKNPSKKVKKVKEPVRRKKAIDDIDIEMMRNAIMNLKSSKNKHGKIGAKRNRAIFELLLSSGIRIGGLVNLKTSDIDLENRTAITVEKGNKERIIYFDASTELALREYLEIRQITEKSGDKLFLSTMHPYKPLEISGAEILIRDIGRSLGIEKIHPHRFRRTFATRASKRGMAIEDVQRLMGHKKIETTQIYIDSDEESARNAYKKVMG
jgi:hypothetical protein|nr:MAG TPA: SITE SPECIFIC RECOMBINASE XERD [Caudoviricetes sp.]